MVSRGIVGRLNKDIADIGIAGYTVMSDTNERGNKTKSAAKCVNANEIELC